MCTKKSLKVCYHTKDYTNGELVANRKKVFDEIGCLRCTYNYILTGYLTLDVPYQLVHAVIDDDCAVMVFELNFKDAIGTHKRRTCVIVTFSDNFQTLGYE